MTAIQKEMILSDSHRLSLDLDLPDVPAGKVNITLLVTPVHTPDNEATVACLREIASRGNLKNGPDPVQWQREIREDRPLPGRD